MLMSTNVVLLESYAITNIFPFTIYQLCACKIQDDDRDIRDNREKLRTKTGMHCAQSHVADKDTDEGDKCADEAECNTDGCIWRNFKKRISK